MSLGQRQVRRKEYPSGLQELTVLVRKTEEPKPKSCTSHRQSYCEREGGGGRTTFREIKNSLEAFWRGDTVKTWELVEFQQLQRELSRSREVASEGALVLMLGYEGSALLLSYSLGE